MCTTLTKVSIVVFVIFCFLCPSFLSAKIYIRVDQFSEEKFPIAITKFKNRSTTQDTRKIGDTLDALIQRDLSFLMLFRFVSSKAFLEDPKKSRFTVDTIDFANWAVLDAQALIKGWYSFGKRDSLTIETYLFDVLTQKKIRSRKYTSKAENINEMVHRISDDIVEALTGIRSIFSTKIAFVSNRTGNKEIYVMDFDGSNPKRITNNRSINISPSWSREGRKIAFTSFKGRKGSKLMIADVTSGSTKTFRKLEGTIISPVFSPVSDSLALSLEAKYKKGIFLFNPKSYALKKLTLGASINVSPSFSPNGREFVFSSNRSGKIHIFKKSVDAPDREATRLTFLGTRNVNPAWSPQRDKIVFSGMDIDGQHDLFLMNTDGSNLVRLTYDKRSNEDPSWSPDGQYIVFSSNRTGRYQLYVMRPSVMSEHRQLTFGEFNHTQPDWSPRF